MAKGPNRPAARVTPEQNQNHDPTLRKLLPRRKNSAKEWTSPAETRTPFHRNAARATMAQLLPPEDHRLEHVFSDDY